MLSNEQRFADLPPKPQNKAQLIKMRMQQEQQQRHAIDAAPIVEVYKPDSKPNAPLMPERAPNQRQAGKENYYQSRPEQRYVSNEPVYMEMEKLGRPKKQDYDENIFALAQKKPDV